MSVVSGRRLTGFLAGLRRRIRVLCQPRSENCPGLPIFFGEGDLWFGLSSFRDVAFCELFSSLRDQFRISVMGEAVPSSAETFTRNRWPSEDTAYGWRLSQAFVRIGFTTAANSAYAVDSGRK